jgi:hypothetical protein
MHMLFSSEDIRKPICDFQPLLLSDAAAAAVEDITYTHLCIECVLRFEVYTSTCTPWSGIVLIVISANDYLYITKSESQSLLLQRQGGNRLEILKSGVRLI